MCARRGRRSQTRCGLGSCHAACSSFACAVHPAAGGAVHAVARAMNGRLCCRHLCDAASLPAAPPPHLLLDSCTILRTRAGGAWRCGRSSRPRWRAWCCRRALWAVTGVCCCWVMWACCGAAQPVWLGVSTWCWPKTSACRLLMCYVPQTGKGPAPPAKLLPPGSANTRSSCYLACRRRARAWPSQPSGSPLGSAGGTSARRAAGGASTTSGTWTLWAWRVRCAVLRCVLRRAALCRAAPLQRGVDCLHWLGYGVLQVAVQRSRVSCHAC